MNRIIEQLIERLNYDYADHNYKRGPVGVCGVDYQSGAFLILKFWTDRGLEMSVEKLAIYPCENGGTKLDGFDIDGCRIEKTYPTLDIKTALSRILNGAGAGITSINLLAKCVEAARTLH